jgi:hypothetical protein
MFEWLTTILFVILLLIWILDHLGLLDVFAALFELIGTVVAAILRLATWLVRKIAAPRNANLPPSPSAESPPRGYNARSRGSRRPLTD